MINADVNVIPEKGLKWK